MQKHAIATVRKPGTVEWAALRRIDLLDQLHAVHEELLENITALETACADPTPSRERYPIARWRLSNASRKRRALLATIYAELGPEVDPRQALVLEHLRADDELQLSKSIAHVRIWGPEDIERDWDGYRQASSRIRLEMRRRVDREKLMLYPIILREEISRAA